MQQQMEPRAEDGSSVMQGPRITLSNVLKGESAIAKLDAFGHLRVRRKSDEQQPPSLWENHPAGDYVAIYSDHGKQFFPTARERLYHSATETHYVLKPLQPLPLQMTERCVKTEEGCIEFSITFQAVEDVCFNFSREIMLKDNEFSNCQFLLPGFWYKHNTVHTTNKNVILCPTSPALSKTLTSFAYSLYPSVNVGTTWTAREDRLAYPLAGAFNEKTNAAFAVGRLDPLVHDSACRTSHPRGEVTLEGPSDVGSVGFKNNAGTASLIVQFPFYERDFSYQRKGNILPLEEQGPVQAFLKLKAGEIRTIRWQFRYFSAPSFHDFVNCTWEAAYNRLRPAPVENTLTDDQLKDILVQYHQRAYRRSTKLSGFECIDMDSTTCEPLGQVHFEVGFVGRILLNAFFLLTYAHKTNRNDLETIAYDVFNTWFADGWTEHGLLKELYSVDLDSYIEVFTLRRQAEGLLALLLFLEYERFLGRTHPERDERVRYLLDLLINLQGNDGSMPRAFSESLEVVDGSPGCTSCMVPTLVHGYRYFQDSKYLDIANHATYFIIGEVVEKDNYVSCTIDANCPDKEAAIYAATAMWYMAGLTNVLQLKRRYVNVAAKAADFALSYYMLYDVPFAPEHFLGQCGLQTRGWGLVSAENNHIDVYTFDLIDVLDWISEETGCAKYTNMGALIRSSIREQLLPREGRLVGIAYPGFQPELVQHTLWDYGKHGKGRYNYFMAFGWTVASQYRMLLRWKSGFMDFTQL